MNEYEDFRVCWQTMPDDDLKRIYRHKLKTQRRLAGVTWVFLLPALLIYGVMGWADFLAAEYSAFLGGMSGSSAGVLYFIAFAACGGAMMSREEKSFYLIPLILPLTAVTVYGIYGIFSMIAAALEVYVLIACVILRFVVCDLNFLKALPSFPFEGQRAEADMNGLSHKDMLDQLNRAYSGVQQVGYEDIFTADDPREIASPREKTEEYFQQHKLTYNTRESK